jgi:secreted PhoX family phosphatase
MGDDSRNEYIYKYVSTVAWDPADATRGAAAGDKYLDDGKLYVARFNADGSGTWLELRVGVNNITSANAGVRVRQPGRGSSCTRASRPTPPAPPGWIVPSGAP